VLSEQDGESIGNGSDFANAMRGTKETRKRTVRSAPIGELPLWLRRLDRVKAELKGTRFPRTAEEGFRQCMMLSTMARRWLRDSIKDNHPEASEERLEAERRRLLARLSSAECRWLAEWKKERVRYFRN
jgi:hypothetical protein